MFNSILDDFKYAMRTGNMVTRIIIVNVIVFIVMTLINVFDFDSGFTPYLVKKLSLLSNPLQEIMQPWSLVTHMFLHVGFWHILWNMLLLYWFGRVIGDFIGDQRILPIYLLGGLCGGLFFVLWDQLLPGGSGMAYAYGASAAVWAIIMTTAMISPDYIFHLFLIGPIKIKYIAFVMLLLDLISIANNQNTGGQMGHLGGAFFGVFYVYMLRQGTDLTSGLQGLFSYISDLYYRQPRKKTPRSTFKVYSNAGNKKENAKSEKSFSDQEELDRILEKIKAKGYDKLSDEEKDFLYQASKKK